MADMNFDNIMNMMSMFGGDKKDFDIMSIFDMIMPKKSEKNYNKSCLFENTYHESNDIKCLKSSVPYLQYNHQKNILLMIKIIEIKKLLEIYNTNDKKVCEKHDLFGLLEEILPYTKEKEQEDIKRYLQLSNIAERI